MASNSNNNWAASSAERASIITRATIKAKLGKAAAMTKLYRQLLAQVEYWESIMKTDEEEDLQDYQRFDK